MPKRLKIAVSICLAIVMVTVPGQAVNFEIGVQDDSPIDIILTGTGYSYTPEESEQKILQYLAEAGVDTSRVEFLEGYSTVITSDGSGAQEIVDTWGVFPEGRGGQTVINDGAMMIGPDGQFSMGGMFDPENVNHDGDKEVNFTFQTTCIPYSPCVLINWHPYKKIDPATGAEVTAYEGYCVGLSTNSHAHTYSTMDLDMYIWKVTTSDFAPWYIGATWVDQAKPTYQIGDIMRKCTYYEPHRAWYDFTGATGCVAFKWCEMPSQWGGWERYKCDGIMSATAPNDPGFRIGEWNGCSNRGKLQYAPKYNYHVTWHDGTIRFELSAERINGQTLEAADHFPREYQQNTKYDWVLEWTDPNPITKGSIGFGSHNANAVGMNGAKFKLEDNRDLLESVRAPKWRPNSHRFVIDAMETPREDFNEVAQMGELAQRLDKDGVHYVGWYNTTTQAQQVSFKTKVQNLSEVFNLGSAQRFRDTAYWMEPIVNRHFDGDEMLLIKDKVYDYIVTERN